MKHMLMQAAGRTIETAEQYAHRAKEGLYEGKEKAKHTTQEAAQRAAEKVCFSANRDLAMSFRSVLHQGKVGD